MEIDDIVIRVRVVAEDAKYIIQTLTNSFLRMEEIKNSITNTLPQPAVGMFAEQYQSVMALKNDIAEGIEIPVAMSAEAVIPFAAAEPVAAQAVNTVGLITSQAQSNADSTGKLLNERESYYSKLISLVKNKEASVSAEIKASCEQRLSYLKSSFEAEINAYEQRIAEIDNLLKTNERRDYDAEYNDKMLRLSELLKYENDEGNRYELEKEMAAINKDYESRKEREALYDERSALQELASAARASYAEQTAAVRSAMAEELEAVKKSYSEQLESLNEKMNSELAALRQSQEEKNALAEKEQNQFQQYINGKLNMQRDFAAREYILLSNAQSGIISMLYSRLGEFAAVGASLGSAFSYSFENQMAVVQARIDSLRAQLAALGADGGAGTQSTSYVFNQTITGVESSPSQIARETKSLLENAVYYC